MRRTAALVAATLLSAPLGALTAQETILRTNNGPAALPLGTTRGERANRLVIRGATVLSGRGTRAPTVPCLPKGQWTS